MPRCSTDFALSGLDHFHLPASTSPLMLHSIVARRLGTLSGRGRLSRSFASLSSVVQLGDIKAYEKLEQEKDKKHILYFTATWCPPCRKIGPVFEELSKNNEDILFVKVDIDQLPEAAERNAIRSVPTFIFKKGDRVVEQFSGADEAALVQNMVQLRGV